MPVARHMTTGTGILRTDKDLQSVRGALGAWFKDPNVNDICTNEILASVFWQELVDLVHSTIHLDQDIPPAGTWRG